MATPSGVKDFQTSLYFLKPDELYSNQKPYAFKFPLSTADIPSSNIDHVKREVAYVKDIRSHKSTLDLRKSGFTLLDIGRAELAYEDYHDELKVRAYFRAVERILKDHLGARDVRVFRHAIRKRHPEWPLNTGQPYEYDQPTTTVHIDCTPQEVLREVKTHHAEQFDELTKGRVQWINFWKPLKGPLNDWPLILCDSSTVNKQRDLEPADLLYPDRVAENCLVYESSRYEWYYLSDHKTSEILVFVQGDSLQNALPGVPHCSVPNPLASKQEQPRESIEVRCLAFYDP